MTPAKKILVADDDLAICESLQLMLEEDGYTVDITQDGGSLKKLQKGMYDLVILDVWMSGHDGSKICMELKADKKTDTIPIILMTARRDAERIALDAGADDFIAKPFSMVDLLNKVAKHV
jgi:DNA-binding response OmpR family regulator